MSSLPEAAVERPYGEPPKLDAKPDYKVAIKRAAAKFSQDQCTDLAAALTYYSVQALFPAIIAAVSTIGLFGNGKKTTDAIIKAIAGIAGKKQSDIPSGFTDFITKLQSGGGAGLAFIIGILLSLWSASGYVGAFARMSNRIYDVAEGRPVYKLRPWLYFVTIVSFVIAIIAAMTLVISGEVANQVFGSIGLGSQAATVWDWVKLPFVAVFVIVAISFIFWGTPNVKRSFKEAMFNPGAIVAFLVWAIGSFLFAWYVSNMGNYGKTYGPMALPIILLLWLWITNLAMLFGAEFDSEVLRTRQLKSGYPAEELVLLPVRDEKEIDKKASKYDDLVEQAHELRLSSGVPDAAVASMMPVAPGSRSDERTTAAQAGNSEKRPATPQARTVERAPALASATKDEAPDLTDEGHVAHSRFRQASRPSGSSKDAVEREHAEVEQARDARRREAIAIAEAKRAQRDRIEAQRKQVEEKQKKAEAERAKERKQAEAERPLEQQWAEVENTRDRYAHEDTREYRAVQAERAERRRRWFSA